MKAPKDEKSACNVLEYLRVLVRTTAQDIVYVSDIDVLMGRFSRMSEEDQAMCETIKHALEFKSRTQKTSPG
jgi:hypothetical protein